VIGQKKIGEKKQARKKIPVELGELGVSLSNSLSVSALFYPQLPKPVGGKVGGVGGGCGVWAKRNPPRVGGVWLLCREAGAKLRRGFGWCGCGLAAFSRPWDVFLCAVGAVWAVLRIFVVWLLCRQVG
jgi:hypothetical protein